MAPLDTSTGSLFRRLREGCGADWDVYVGHPFVRGIADGSLPQAAFRYYLIQDYIFLFHFARAYALAGYKADTLEDLRDASRALSTIIDVETALHVRYCAGWGISEKEMIAFPEDPANSAYTRFVLDRGLAGDILDLYVALAPCTVGYGEVGRRLLADPATKRDGNPYREWIESYGGADYQEVVRNRLAQLDRLYAARGGEARLPSLIETFRKATQLEIGFWQMGLSAT